MEQRPMMPFMVEAETVMREYVVEKVFKNAKEAKAYAKKNKIKDVNNVNPACNDKHASSFISVNICPLNQKKKKRKKKIDYLEQ